jgi:hypothetical protein
MHYNVLANLPQDCGERTFINKKKLYAGEKTLKSAQPLRSG